MCGCSGAPTAAGVVAGGHSVPEVASDGVPLSVASAVAAPGGVGVARFSVDEDGVGLWVELVAAVPSSVASGDVAQLGV